MGYNPNRITQMLEGHTPLRELGYAFETQPYLHHPLFRAYQSFLWSTQQNPYFPFFAAGEAGNVYTWFKLDGFVEQELSSKPYSLSVENIVALPYSDCFTSSSRLLLGKLTNPSEIVRPPAGSHYGLGYLANPLRPRCSSQVCLRAVSDERGAFYISYHEVRRFGHSSLSEDASPVSMAAFVLNPFGEPSLNMAFRSPDYVSEYTVYSINMEPQESQESSVNDLFELSAINFSKVVNNLI